MESVRLTSFSHGAGCACKLGSVELSQVLGSLKSHPASSHPDLVVGLGTSDDAGVFALPGDGGRALVQTVDYFTPIIDDPYDWGRIAATNALSDVYAMGGRPLTALQILGWPRRDLPLDIASRVVDGGADVMANAGCVVVGGHTIDVTEPIYGFAVTGLVETENAVTNAGAEVGDVLVLTKPLGTGIIATAHKAGACPPEILAGAVRSMTTLNDVAGSALGSAHAATDVTGFGFLGHLLEMLDASKVGARIDVASVPLLDGVVGLHADGFYPGGSRRNLAAVRDRVEGSEEALPLLADAQTSGGLLVALPEGAVDDYIARVPSSTRVGVVTDRQGVVEVA
ncbi:MAG TPA: selenide, water dikinase SelD [Acidimicrobiia bacterium]